MEIIIDFIIKAVLSVFKKKTGDVSKVIVASMICKHPELSDRKVKYLTEMMK